MDPEKLEPEWVLPDPVGRKDDGSGDELRFKGPTLFIMVQCCNQFCF